MSLRDESPRSGTYAKVNVVSQYAFVPGNQSQAIPGVTGKGESNHYYYLTCQAPQVTFQVCPENGAIEDK